MGSKTELPHVNMPLRDTLEDLESSFDALVRQKVASGHAANFDDESEEFMSQLNLKLDSLQKDEMFDLVDQSPLQELGSLPPPNRHETGDSDNAVPQNLDPLLSDTEKDNISDVHSLEDSSLDGNVPSSSDVHLLEGNNDCVDGQVVHSKTTELVLQTAPFDTLLEHTTPLGSMYSNDTSAPPEEHDPRKGINICTVRCM